MQDLIGGRKKHRYKLVSLYLNGKTTVFKAFSMSANINYK